MKFYWEIIANNLSKRDWSWGCSEQRDHSGQTIFAVDAHRGFGAGNRAQHNTAHRAG
jgi:hypothetical protein